MAARTGKEYVSGLRADGREVWLGADRVHDVTGHPAFAGSLRGMAGFFDWQHRHAEDCIATDPGLDRPVGIAHVIPHGPEDLARRHRGLEKLARYSAGMLGRTPDYVSLTFAGFAGQPSVWSANGNARGAGNLIAFQRHVAEKDLALTHTIIHPGGGRPGRPLRRRQPGGRAQEGGRDRRRDSSCAAPASSPRWGPFADELAVYPGQPIPKDAARRGPRVLESPWPRRGSGSSAATHYGLDADPIRQALLLPASTSRMRSSCSTTWRCPGTASPRRRPGHLQRDHGPGAGSATSCSRPASGRWSSWSSPTSSVAAWRTPPARTAGRRSCRCWARSGATPSSPAPRSAPREADAHEFGDGVWFCAEAPFRALAPNHAGVDAAGERDHQAHRLAQPSLGHTHAGRTRQPRAQALARPLSAGAPGGAGASERSRPCSGPPGTFAAPRSARAPSSTSATTSASASRGLHPGPHRRPQGVGNGIRCPRSGSTSTPWRRT